MFASGCGLSEYEQRMASEQTRLAAIDQENKILGDQIDLPPRRPTPATQPPPPPLPELFMRVPKAISSKADEEAFTGGVLYRFSKLASPKETAQKDTGLLEIYLAVGLEKKGEEFRKEVLQRFGTTQALRPDTRQPVGRSPLTFEACSFLDARLPQSSYSVYLYPAGSNEVAIVFRAEATTAALPLVREQMDYTLKSFALGNTANQLRRDFKPRPG
jgi:hypothetical protein